jgi:hypothetical protein
MSLQFCANYGTFSPSNFGCLLVICEWYQPKSLHVCPGKIKYAYVGKCHCGVALLLSILWQKSNIYSVENHS